MCMSDAMRNLAFQIYSVIILDSELNFFARGAMVLPLVGVVEIFFLNLMYILYICIIYCKNSNRNSIMAQV